MARVAKADVHAALEQAAQNIIDAAGPDQITSRKNLKDKLAELKGAERGLTAMFFGFIDHRDHEPGARVTEPDVRRALTYAKKELVDDYDLNGNGLSKDEISAMSTTGKLAVRLAQEMKARAKPAVSDCCE